MDLDALPLAEDASTPTAKASTVINAPRKLLQINSVYHHETLVSPMRSARRCSVLGVRIEE